MMFVRIGSVRDQILLHNIYQVTKGFIHQLTKIYYVL